DEVRDGVAEPFRGVRGPGFGFCLGFRLLRERRLSSQGQRAGGAKKQSPIDGAFGFRILLLRSHVLLPPFRSLYLILRKRAAPSRRMDARHPKSGLPD